MRRLQVALIGPVIVAATATALPADSTPVGVADREQATSLVDEANRATQQGDRRRATGLLFSALRWDPSRHADYARAIDWLEPIDPAAAVRHACVLIEADPDAAAVPPALLKRLRDAAASMESPQGEDAAARLTRHLLRWVEENGPTEQGQLIDLWLETAQAYAAAGDAGRASDAFETWQQFAEAPDGPWSLIAQVHLDAGRLDQADRALDAWQRRDGASPRLLSLRARGALLAGQPLEAVEHATNALREVGEAEEATVYGVFVEAMRAANQSAYAAELLDERLASFPDNRELATAVVDAYDAAGDAENAWLVSGRLVSRELRSQAPLDPSRVFLRAGDPVAESPPSLGYAFSQRLQLAAKGGYAAEALAELPAVVARIEGLEPLEAALAEACQNESFREAAAVWLRDPGGEGDPPIGIDRAAVTVALLIDRPRVAVRKALAASRRALADGDNVGPLADAIGNLAEDLCQRGHGAAATDLARAGIGLIEGADASDGAAPTARLKTVLADLLTRWSADSEPARSESAALIAAAVAGAPDDAVVAYDAARLHLRDARFDDAIDAGRRLLSRWPLPAGGQGLGETRHREVRVGTARALLARGGVADRFEAAARLEGVLDQWPADAEALASLALHDAELESHRSRAERLALRAAELSPDSAVPWGVLADLKRRGGQPTKAVALYEKAVSRLESGPAVTPWEAEAIHAGLAATLRSAGRAEEAETLGSP